MAAVTTAFLEPYLSSKYRHSYYHDGVELAEELAIHANGEFPDDLISERRPAESEEIRNYRRKIFTPITKPVFTKVYNSLMKIRKSSDWMISFPTNIPAFIAEEEAPEKYIMKDLPRNSSITNWMFSVAFKPYLIDANAVVLTMPISYEIAENEYFKPYPRIFTSAQVLDYRINEFYLLQDAELFSYEEDDYYFTNGRRFFLIQPDIFQVFEEKNGKVSEVFQFPNVLGYIPVRHMNGMVVQQGNHCTLYESRISGIVPMLDEAVREYSDLQAEIVQHIHSTMWAIQPQQCGRCKGVGEIPRENSVPVSCPGCGGKGLLPLNPFEHIVMPMPKAGENNAITPPIGYVQKQTDIARLQEERIRQHIYDALSAISMEFLAETPIAQSGVAKQVDREELYSFVHSIAEDIVRIMDEVVYDILAWRHYAQNVDINELLPYIPVPERYDMLSGKVLVDELTAMVNAKVDPAIINAAQIELADKKFNESKVKDLVILKLKLDPFAGVPEENITLLKTFDAINKSDLVIHANISKFVTRAINEIEGFADMSYTEQEVIMQQYATEQTTPKPVVGGVSVQGMEVPDSVDQKRLDAQATLKGTVGGVQGILEIQKSVALGITDRDAAIALLIEIYGFSEEQAVNVVGTPKAIPTTGL